MTMEAGGGPPGAGRGLWPRLRFPVVVAAVALAGVAFVAVNHRSEETSASGATPTPSPPAPSATPSAAAPSDPTCLPTVTETGFSVFQDSVEYGVIARSDCPQALINVAVSVRVFDTAGHLIDGDDSLLTQIYVLLPGQQVGFAGSFSMTTIKPVGRVDVRFTDAVPAPVSVFAGWPASVRVADLTIGKPDHTGGVRVTGRIVTEPAGAALCFPHTSLILRDSAGTIVGGTWGQVLGGELGQRLTHATGVKFYLSKVPAEADLSKTTVYVTLGGLAMGGLFHIDPSGAACG